MIHVKSNLYTPHCCISRGTSIFHAKNCITCGLSVQKYGMYTIIQNLCRTDRNYVESFEAFHVACS